MVLKNKSICIILLCAFLSSFCTRQDKNPETKKKDTLSEITLSAKQIELNGIRFGSAELRKMSGEIIANGNIDVPPQYRATVSTAVGGFIKTTDVLEGDHVHKGQVLAELTHPDYVQIQQQYVEALSREGFLQKELERQKYLREENVNSKKELERTESELRILSSQVKAAEARLKILGINPEKVAEGVISPVIQIRSPLDGDVTLVNTTLGKFVRQEEVMFEIVSKDHLHLDLRVYEQDVLKIRPGQKVLYTLGNQSGGEKNAKVILVGKKLDMHTRTVSIHAHPGHDAEGLLPGMYVKAKILINEKETPSLPVDALIREGEKQFIFVVKSKDTTGVTFERIPVKVGVAQEQFAEVDMPLSAHQGKIVVEGAYYLAAQMKKQEGGEEE